MWQVEWGFGNPTRRSRQIPAGSCRTCLDEGDPADLSLARCDGDLGPGLRRLGGHLWIGPQNIDAALEVGAVIDADAGALDVADQAALLADGNFAGDLYVAADTAEDHHLARFDVCPDLAVRTDGEEALRFQESLHVAI